MFKIPFEKLDKDFQILLCTLPMSVFSSLDPNKETDGQLIKTRDRFLILPESIKDKLSSLEVSNKIENLGKNFNLDLIKTATISRAIRNYYFNDIKLEDFPFILSKEIGIDLSRAKEISQAVISQIINDTSFEEAVQASLESIPVQAALKKYPNLGEQLLTSDKITLKNFPSPVRPSIKNWLADFTFILGYDRKNKSMERANYLFHNANAKKLHSSDRQKLSLVLKSYDENTPVTVNKNTQQIIFTPVAPKTYAPPAPAAPKSPSSPPTPLSRQGESGRRPGEGGTKKNMRFSSPQKMPFEKAKGGLQPYRISPFDTGQEGKPEENKNPNNKGNKYPKNVVNLKE